MMNHVLIIEDKFTIAKMLELDLKEAGYQVTVAHDGATGWKIAEENAPDCIVLDWQLPQLNGLEICQRLRTAGRMMPIICTTVSDETRPEALQAGATDYLAKPFSIEHLKELIERGKK